MIQHETPQQESKKRKPPTCSICNCIGHQMRTCNDATILFQRNYVFEQIEKHTPLETIIAYAQHQDFQRMKIITYKTPKGKTSNISPLSADETTYYTNLERYITTEYEKQTNQVVSHIQRKIFYTRRLLPRTTSEIVNLYTNYIAESYTSNQQNGTIENVDQEITQFLHLCDTMSLEVTNYTPFPTYDVLTRWNAFLQRTSTRYLADMQARNRPPPAPVVVETYNYVKRPVGEDATETIDCPICMETINTPNISETNCGHKYCTPCIRRTIRKYTAHKRCPCPMCREPIRTVLRKYTNP